MELHPLFFLTPYMSPAHFEFLRGRAYGHVHVPTCTWGMCLENPKCAGDIYGVRKKKRVQFHCLVPELLADEVGVQLTGKFAL